ncbi:FecR family protein [Pseudoflavitalea rhizosphaerae]|uniref:FecR family protein n=1 Tax=Pseudoflavitalea rhizosphaerae TaxID=1884793 RepID=UPI000F8F7940|nr:FecR family protein [Pseudoflavitalea rhizosphaerae]
MQNDLEYNDELLATLFKKWSDQPLTPAEEQLLNKWLAASPDNPKAFDEILDENWVRNNLKEWTHSNAEQIWQRSREQAGVVSINSKRRPIAGWVRYAAAVLLIAGGAWFLWEQSETNKQTSTGSAQQTITQDIAPGTQIATLTLSDGSTILLDSAAKGVLAKQGNAEIRKDAAGQISYTESNQRNKSSENIRYNTMSTPKGGQYQLVLPDGTKVYLNAASSITYPVAFVTGTRTVTLTGEAYFEVAADARLPFIVETVTDKITVLGTRFNINAYADEKAIKSTLVEGSIKVNDRVLKPGEAYSNGKVFATDTDQDIAWKNGIFDFNNISVQDAMRQLSRWYNIKVVYDEPVDETFLGKIGRNLTLNQVLKIMDGAGAHFRLEGNTLHVSR